MLYAQEERSVQGSFGAVTIDGKVWNQIAFRPVIPIWKFGVALDLVFYFDADGNLHKDEWDFSSGGAIKNTLIDKIYYIRYGFAKDPLYVKVGSLDYVKLGYGILVNGYTNTIEYPQVRKVGLDFSVKRNLFSVQGFANDFKENIGLFGARIQSSKLMNIPLGVSAVMDRNQHLGLRDRDRDKYPDIFDHFPNNGNKNSNALDNYEEWKHILGSWTVWIFHIMHTIVTSNSKVISCNPRLYDRQRSFLVNPSRLSSEWFKNYKEVPLDKIRLLYVGRINPEKGIYDFIKMFDKIKLNSEFSIVGYKNNLKIKNKNIKLLGYCSEPKSLINIYDNHNIMILPSFTESHPYVVDECLSRKRPVIIFESISYIATNKQGIFVSKRDLDSFLKVVNYIMNNYEEVQKNIEKNKLPIKEDFFRQFSDIFKE